MKRGYVPKVKPNKSCNACSLKNLCLPKLMKASDAKKYVKENVCEGAEGRL
jgi:CRISPR-associated exonuclease Cas4